MLAMKLVYIVIGEEKYRFLKSYEAYFNYHCIYLNIACQ